MVRMVRSCMQSLLKMVNSVIGMVGIAMILYALWLIRVWEIHMGHFPPAADHPVPWFIYTFLVLGVILCVITCSGHIAAETANGCCLHLYMFFVFLLLMMEAGVTTDVFLNSDWEEDFPADSSGSFTQFKNFIRSNFEICKWIGLSIVSVQGLCFLLALILKALGPHQYYDNDDEYSLDRAPLLKSAVYPPTYVVGDPVYGSRADAWTIRVNEKVTCFALVKPDIVMWIASIEKQLQPLLSNTISRLKLQSRKDVYASDQLRAAERNSLLYVQNTYCPTLYRNLMTHNALNIIYLE